MPAKRQVSFLYVLIPYSFFLMLFFTQSSPLFLFNEWVDANSFFTVGKGIVHGLVPYRDLFEQKGPLLYFIHAIAYLISPKTFFGVYLLESVAMSVNLILLYKIANHYLKPWQSIWTSLIFPFFLLHKPYFQLGDSAEEFAYPFIIGLIYFIFVFIWNHYRVKPIYFFLQGLLGGCVLWMKFTLIGSWIGFFLIVLIVMLSLKEYKLLSQYILAAFLGLLASTLPWLLYFGVTGSLKDLFEVYFYFNLVLYPDKNSFLHSCGKAILTLFTSFQNEPLLFLFLYIGIGAFLTTDILSDKAVDKLMFFSAFFFNGLAAFYGGTIIYYFLILIPYTCLGLLILMISLLKNKRVGETGNKVTMTVLLASYCFLMTFSVNQNILGNRFLWPSGPPSESLGPAPAVSGLAQTIFADIMNQRENPTMLNYGFLDGGFYTFADILPVNRFFMKQNIPYEVYPDNMDEHNQIVRDEAVDFLVLRSEKDKNFDDAANSEIQKHYRLLAAHQQDTSEGTKIYWLLERNSNYAD